MIHNIFCLTLLAFTPSVLALLVDISQDDVISVSEIDAPVVIDGRLNDAVWQNLPEYDEFSVTDPDTLVKPSHETRVRLFYNEEGLYLGILMRQPKETLISRLSSRDNREIKRDNINLTLDTSGEGRYGYWFGINLGDTQMDGTLLPERQFSNDWDGAWRRQQPHLRRVGAPRCLFPGGLSQCRKWRASGGLDSICLASWPISMSVGGGPHCLRPSQNLFQHSNQLLYATSTQNSSIQYSHPWALRPTGLITM